MALRGKKLVVADDDPDGRETLKILLELFGYQVRTARDGPTAVQEISCFQPAAAIIDVSMPGFNGYKVAQQVRAQSWGREIKLIALTGYGCEDDRQSASRAGFDVYLTKPLRADELKRFLKHHLGGE
ncbi:MAG TPA: response regulator [Candidatus Binataceae bacterium]|nr:response regulator [Candidatus Binataceae bacterium]